MKQITVTDLVLHAASICHLCRQGTRPDDRSDQEHGDLFLHMNAKGAKCNADQVWALIRRLEAE